MDYNLFDEINPLLPLGQYFTIAIEKQLGQPIPSHVVGDGGCCKFLFLFFGGE